MRYLAAIESEAAAGIALRVEVDHENGFTGQGQIRGEVDHGRGLADAALLVGAGDDLTHSGPHFGRRHVQILAFWAVFRASGLFRGAARGPLASGAETRVPTQVPYRSTLRRGLSARYRGLRRARGVGAWQQSQGPSPPSPSSGVASRSGLPSPPSLSSGVASSTFVGPEALPGTRSSRRRPGSPGLRLCSRAPGDGPGRRVGSGGIATRNSWFGDPTHKGGPAFQVSTAATLEDWHRPGPRTEAPSLRLGAERP